ncbi:hypothetical protein JG687_00015665 [Phytophthora cactorum]|uniref:Uncharacterized protein n=1 Tax=Phytophthora cactorum TaxID=29920 RepID=A0A8T1TWB8_9STRA|nr:hypothetical protein JG687_00015665 [Phytophthora cactorum]
MVFLIQRNLPIAEVENQFSGAVGTMKPTSVKTIKPYMRYVALPIGYIITKEIGTSFCLVFDGWTSHSLPFLAVYAVYVYNGERHQRLLALLPMEDGHCRGSLAAYIFRAERVREFF